MEELPKMEFNHRGRSVEYSPIELIDKLENDYQDQSEYPIGVMVPFEGGMLDDSLHKLNRTRFLAEDYTDLFKLGITPEFYREDFRPFADLIQPDIGLEEMEEVLWENLDDSGNEHYVVRLNCHEDNIEHWVENILKARRNIIPVNPPPAKRILSDKRKQLDFLDEQNYPIIPYMDAVKAARNGKDYVEDKIGNTGDGWIVKETVGAGGYQVHEADDMEGVKEILNGNLDRINGGSEYILQPRIKHDYDYRVMLIGEGSKAAERRYGINGDTRTNLSPIGSSFSERLLRGSVREAFHPMKVDNREIIEDEELLEDDNLLIREVQHLGDHLVDAFEEFRHPDAVRPNFFISADIMMTNEESLKGLPAEYIDRMNEYKSEEGIPALIELNDGGGDIISYAVDAYDPRDLPALYEIELLKDLAGHESIPPHEIPGDYGTREWRRAEYLYRGTSHTEIVARENILKNSQNEFTELATESLNMREREAEQVWSENFGTTITED